MLIRKQSQDRKRSAATIGCWAALLTSAAPYDNQLLG